MPVPPFFYFQNSVAVLLRKTYKEACYMFFQNLVAVFWI